jgi:hypothetical protein
MLGSVFKGVYVDRKPARTRSWLRERIPFLSNHGQFIRFDLPNDSDYKV